MLDEGWVEIIKKEFNPNTFTDEKRDKYNAKVEQINSEQYKYLRDERIQQIRTNLDKIVAGRKKKLLKSGVPESEINIDPEEEVNKILGNFKSDPQKLLKQIPTQEIFDTGKMIQLKFYHFMTLDYISYFRWKFNYSYKRRSINISCIQIIMAQGKIYNNG